MYKCDKEFDQSILEEHNFRFHNKDLTEEESMKQQIQDGHTHKCKSCDKSFSQAQTLKKHIYAIHEGHKDYKCESCSKSFSQAGNLKNHINTVHEGHKDHKCESCSKSFTEAGSLKRHMKTIHKGHKVQVCN